MADPFSVSLIIPTISRPTLARTLWSVRRQRWGPDDEIILIGDGPQPVAEDLWRQFRLPGRYVEVPRTVPADWGHTPRNLIAPSAKGAYLAALDDDDQWPDETLNIIRRALRENPGRPHIFRQSGCPVTGTVWKVPEIVMGNVGTPTFVVPNVPGKIGRYVSRYGGDCDFIRETCSHYPDGPVWREEVITLIRPV